MSERKSIVLNKPNFFILGAGKSGTTSLYSYLKQHPSVFMSPVKEPTFFCKGFQVVKDPIQYFELFDSVNGEPVIGEASHAYLTYPSTARVLKALFPEAKFVVVLRNPADRAYSLYHHMRREGDERISTFEEALEYEEKRASSDKFRDNCPQYFYNFLYFRSGLYGEQIERYLSLYSYDQFHFLTLDELKRNPKGALDSILRFLHLNTEFEPILKVRNEGLITARVPLIQYLWKHKVKHPQFIRKQGFKILSKINFIKVPPIRTETRKALLARYASDLENLNRLTGIRF
jgi:hypothetical protein